MGRPAVFELPVLGLQNLEPLRLVTGYLPPHTGVLALLPARFQSCFGRRRLLRLDFFSAAAFFSASSRW